MGNIYILACLITRVLNLKEMDQNKKSETIRILSQAIRHEKGTVRTRSINVMGKLCDQRCVRPLIPYFPQVKNAIIRHFPVLSISKCSDS